MNSSSLLFQDAAAARMFKALPYGRLKAMFAERTELEVLSLLSDFQLQPRRGNETKRYIKAKFDLENAPSYPGANEGLHALQNRWAMLEAKKWMCNNGFPDGITGNGSHTSEIYFLFEPTAEMSAEAFLQRLNDQSEQARITLATARVPT